MDPAVSAVYCIVPSQRRTIRYICASRPQCPWTLLTPHSAVDAFFQQKRYGGLVLTRDTERRLNHESLLYQVLVHFRTPWLEGDVHARKVFDATALLLENGARFRPEMDVAPLVLAVEALNCSAGFLLPMLRLLHRFRHVFTDVQIHAPSPVWPRGGAIHHLTLYAGSNLSEPDFREAVGLLVAFGLSPRSRGVYGRDWTPMEACHHLSGSGHNHDECPFHSILAPRVAHLQSVADQEALPERRERAVWVHLALEAARVPLALQDCIAQWWLLPLDHHHHHHVDVVEVSLANAARAVARVHASRRRAVAPVAGR
jgi:hypothetical protein